MRYRTKSSQNRLALLHNLTLFICWLQRKYPDRLCYKFELFTDTCPSRYCHARSYIDSYTSPYANSYTSSYANSHTSPHTNSYPKADSHTNSCTRTYTAATSTSGSTATTNINKYSAH